MSSLKYRFDNNKLVVEQEGVKSTLVRNLLVHQQRADAALHNAKVSRETSGGLYGPGEGRHIGDMPIIVYTKFVQEAQGDPDRLDDLIRQWFTDPDNASFRAWGKW